MDTLEKTAAQVIAALSDIPFVRDNHISVASLRRDEVCLRMDSQEKHLNQYGTLHGGYTLLLADCAAGAAALTDGRTYITQSQNFAFLRACRGGAIHATGRVISRGKTVTVVHVETRDGDGTLFGDGSFNMYAVRGQAHGGEA